MHTTGERLNFGEHEMQSISRKFTILIMTIAVLSGCATVQKQAFNKEANQDIRKIAVLDTSSSGEFLVQNLGHPGMGFGLIGGLVAAADMESKSKTFTEKMKGLGFDPAKEFNAALIAELQALKYDIKTVKPVRPNRALLESYENLDGEVDAYVDSVMNWSGYFTASPTANYIPAMRTMVRLVKRNSGEIAYQELISYGYELRGGQAINISADGTYAFSNFDELTSNSEKAMEGMRSGISLLAKQIARDLSN